MEINTCEKYVLAELETYKRRNAELEEKIEELKSFAQKRQMDDNETLNYIMDECDTYRSLLIKMLGNIPLRSLEQNVCCLNVIVRLDEAEKNIIYDILRKGK